MSKKAMLSFPLVYHREKPEELWALQPNGSEWLIFTPGVDSAQNVSDRDLRADFMPRNPAASRLFQSFFAVKKEEGDTLPLPLPSHGAGE